MSPLWRAGQKLARHPFPAATLWQAKPARVGIQQGSGNRYATFLRHHDAKREYAYGPGGGLPDTHVGTFSNELMTKANKNGWIVISMKDDWKRIYAFEK